MTDFVVAQKVWIEQNPLRAWRKQNSMSIFQTASALGVTTTAMQAWEAGASRPADENMAKIAQLTAETDVADKWTTWSEGRPQLA